MVAAVIHQGYPGDHVTLCGIVELPPYGHVPPGDERADCPRCEDLAITPGEPRTRPAEPSLDERPKEATRSAQRPATRAVIRVLYAFVGTRAWERVPHETARDFRLGARDWLTGSSGLAPSTIDRADWEAVFEHFFPGGGDCYGEAR